MTKTKTKIPKLYRQGDVLLERIADRDVPANLTLIPRTDRGVVLQEGEVTGHAHRITSRHAHLYRSETDARYLRVMGPAPVAKTVATPAGEVTVLEAAPGGVALEHEEHDTIAFALGWHHVTIHAEYEPGKIVRQVVD